MKEWWVYIIRCKDGSLYTGIATDVERRLREHEENNGKGAKFLRGRGPLEMVLEKKVGPHGLALKVERKIKKMRKIKKEELIEKPGLLEKMVEGLT
ncbi:MAG: GIY-YIG nuclease family protein [bacterium]|nr:GIY-YIG nuclease family protein [bacterium]